MGDETVNVAVIRRGLWGRVNAASTTTCSWRVNQAVVFAGLLSLFMAVPPGRIGPGAMGPDRVSGR